MIFTFFAWFEKQPAVLLYGFACCVGALFGWLALAPIGFFLVFLIFVPMMIWSISVAKSSFWLGFGFGFGYNLLAFYWIAYAFFISRVPFLAPLAFIGLPTLFGFYWACAFWASKKFWETGLERILSFTFFLTISFWVQSFLWTGFPWNLPAQSWIESNALAQNFHWLGIYAASFIMIFCSACFSIFSENNKKQKIILPILSLSILCGLWSYGALRLESADNLMTKEEVVIIQPNIKQEHKWDRRRARKIINTYFELTKKGIEKIENKKNAIIIWPEAALPIDIKRDKTMRRLIANLLPENINLISGFVHLTPPKVFNSLFALNSEGKIIYIYDKNHLVPFGEYVPFQSLLESFGIRQITGGTGGFGAGTTRPLFQNKILPLICFEISFPREIRADKRPQWIVNITNDGWYQTTPGPYQHFQLARIRAIEFGLPVIRAANTGISAVIDPYGRVIKKQKLETQGFIHSTIPITLEKTPYAIYGEWLFIALLLVNGLCLLALSIYKQ